MREDRVALRSSHIISTFRGAIVYDVGVPVPPDLLLSPDGDRATAVIWAKGFRQGVSEWD